MSALAAQLRSLSSAATAPSAPAQSTPSLLFSPAVAADQSVEAIYHLAVNGVQELVTIAPALFSPFLSSLFHPSTVSLDRASQKASTEAALRRSLSTFLSRLSPFFLHPAAPACLEYLLRRYAIHQWDVQETIDLALPYYDTPLANRLFPLLNLHHSSALPAFSFLQTRNPSTPLDRSGLIAAAAREPAIFTHLHEVSNRQPHPAQLALLVSVGVELLTRKDGGAVVDALLQPTMAGLLEGLDAACLRRSMELHSASLLLLVAVARTHPLDEAVLEAALHRLASTLSSEPSGAERSLAAFSLLLQAQRPLGLSLRCLAPLVSLQRALLPALRALMKRRDCEALLWTLLSSAISAFVSLSLSLSPSKPTRPLRSPTLLPATFTDATAPADSSETAAGPTVARSTAMAPADVLGFIRLLLSSLPLPSSLSVPQLLEHLLDVAAAGAAQCAAAAAVGAGSSAAVSEHLSAAEAMDGESAAPPSPSPPWQLPGTVVLGLSEVWRLLDSEAHRPAVDEWMKERVTRQGQRQWRREVQARQALQRLTQPILSAASAITGEAIRDDAEDGSSRQGRKRKRSAEALKPSGRAATVSVAAAAVQGNDGSAETAEEEVEAEAVHPAVSGEGKKRRRRGERRSMVSLGSSAATARSLLLALLTKGTRHAAVEAAHAGGGSESIGAWQRLWSEEDDERQEGLTALQRLQERSSGSSSPPFSPVHVEEVISDVLLHSSRLPVVRHLLSLPSLLTALPIATLQRLLLQVMQRHTAQLHSSTASLARLSAGLLRCAFTFLSSTLLPRQPSLLPSFLPFYLEHSLIQRDTAKLNMHVRALIAAMQHTTPLFAHLPPAPPPSSLPTSTSSTRSAASTVEDGNQRWVELLAANVWKDRSDAPLLSILRVFEGGVRAAGDGGHSDDSAASPAGMTVDGEHQAWPVGLWCSGLILSLAFELRAEDHERQQRLPLPLLRAFFDALTRHFALLHQQQQSAAAHTSSAAASPSTSSPPPSTASASVSASSSLPSSFFSVSHSALPSFLRYLLDRLLLCLADVTTSGTADEQSPVDPHPPPPPPSPLPSSPRAVLVRDVLVFLFSSPSLSSVHVQVADVLACHLRSQTEASTLLLPLLLPSSSSSASHSLTCSVRAVHLLAAVIHQAGAGQGKVAALAGALMEERLLVPSLIAATASDSSALRRVAITALTAWHQHTAPPPDNGPQHRRLHEQAKRKTTSEQAAWRDAWTVLVPCALRRGEECVSDAGAISSLLSSLSSSAAGSSVCAALMAAAGEGLASHVQLRLISLLQPVPSAAVFNPACALLSQLLMSAESGPLSEENAASLGLLMRRVEAKSITSSADADAAVGLLLRSLSSPPPIALLSVAQLQPELFCLLSPSQQSTLVAGLMRCLLSPSTEAELLDAVSRCLTCLPLSASHLLPHLSFERGEVELSAALDVLSSMVDSMEGGSQLLPPLYSLLRALLKQGELGQREELKLTLLTLLTRLTRRLHSSGAASDASAPPFDSSDAAAIIACLTPQPHPSSSSIPSSTSSSDDGPSSAALNTRVAALTLLSTVAPLLPASASNALLAPLFIHLAALPLTGSSADAATLSLVESTISTVLPALLPAPSSASSMSAQAWSIASIIVHAAPLTPSSAPLYLQLMVRLVSSLSIHSLPGIVCLLLVRGLRQQKQWRRLQEKRAKRRQDKSRKKAKQTQAQLLTAATAAAAGSGGAGDALRQREGGDEAAFDDAGFIHALLDAFTVGQQVDCLVHCAALLRTASSHSLQSMMGQQPFQSSAEKDEWALSVAQLLCSHLSHLPFVSCLLDLSPSARSALQPSYLALFEHLLALQGEQPLHHWLQQPSGEDVEAAAMGGGGGVRSSALSSSLSTALDRASALLSVPSFVSLMSELLRRGQGAGVVERSLYLVHAKLSSVTAHHSELAALATAEGAGAASVSIEEEREALLPLIRPIVSLIPTGGLPWPALSKEQLAEAQLSLACLQSLASALCCALPLQHSHSSTSLLPPSQLHQRRQSLVPVLVRVQGLLSHSSAPLTASALLTLSALLDALELSALPQLPSLLPSVLDLASSAGSSSSTHSAVSLASLMVVRSLIDALPSFLSPYLQRLLLLLLQPHFHSTTARGGEARELVHATSASLIRLQPPAAMLSSLSAAFPPTAAMGRRSLSFLISLLDQLAQRLTPEELRIHLRPLLTFFTQHPFQLRQRRSASPPASSHPSPSLSMADVDGVEDEAVSMLSSLVLRMNERQLKLTFLRLLDWLGTADDAALTSLDPASSTPSPAHSAQLLSRGVVVFKLTRALAERLQSLFVPYALLALDPALHLLHAIVAPHTTHRSSQRNDGEEADGAEADDDSDGETEREKAQSSTSSPSLLQSLIFSSLRVSLSFDVQRLFGKEQLDRLLPALQCLLERPSCWSPSFVSDSLVPLCCQLCQSLSHFHLWKSLHQALLSSAAHRSSAVRLAVVRTVRAMFDAVGSRYLVLLPETLPALNEWLDDEDSEVEREAQRLVKTIEALSGESLDKYLEG